MCSGFDVITSISNQFLMAGLRVANQINQKKEPTMTTKKRSLQTPKYKRLGEVLLGILLGPLS
jgi:hypothetical protein